jgi:hypothetical protein
MKLTKTVAVGIILLLIVVLGGCLGSRGRTCPVQVSQKEGLVIQRIQPSYFAVPVNDQINVFMDVQNRGNAPAKSVRATLWAYAGFCVLVENPDENAEESYICAPVGSARDAAELQSVEVLEAPRLDICSEGDVHTFEWKLKAGCDPVETIMAVVIDYEYASSGYAKIPMASRDEYERMQGKLGAEGENFPSAGPLEIKMESVQMEPVLISEDTNDFSVRITFDNLGSGLVGRKGAGGVNEVRLDLSGPCRFTERNIKYKKELTGATMEDDKKSLHWGNKMVTLKSGDQEIMKFAYLEYDDGVAPLNTFVQDICRVEVTANYRYTNVESPTKRMGVYGSPDQIQNCLAPDN